MFLSGAASNPLSTEEDPLYVTEEVKEINEDDKKAQQQQVQNQDAERSDEAFQDDDDEPGEDRESKKGVPGGSGRFGSTHQFDHRHRDLGHQVAFKHPTRVHNHAVRHPNIRQSRSVKEAHDAVKNIREAESSYGAFKATHRYGHFHHQEHHPEAYRARFNKPQVTHHHYHHPHPELHRQARQVSNSENDDLVEDTLPEASDGKVANPSIGIHDVTHQASHFHHELGHDLHYQHPFHFRPKPLHHRSRCSEEHTDQGEQITGKVDQEEQIEDDADQEEQIEDDADQEECIEDDADQEEQIKDDADQEEHIKDDADQEEQIEDDADQEEQIEDDADQEERIEDDVHQGERIKDHDGQGGRITREAVSSLGAFRATHQYHHHHHGLF